MFNMESNGIFVAFIFVICGQLCVGATVRVEVTTPINSVTVGDILAVQCQVWDIQEGYKVTIVRVVDGTGEQITSDDDILSSSVSDRVFLSIRTFSGGSRVYFLTMLDVSPSDRGEYGCTVSRLSGLGSVLIAQDSVSVYIHQFPDTTQPKCTSNPDDSILTEGSRLELTCATYKTVPVVRLRWRLISTYQYLQSHNTSDKDNLFSVLVVKATKLYKGAVFECEMTSPGFPDRKQFCQIGPLTVIESNDDHGPGSNLITINPGISSSVTTAPSNSLSKDCENTCPSSSFTILILTLSTMATCILTIIFLITTIVMCCKYHDISAQVNRDRSQYTQSRELDPVYVSLQRRREQEQVYMTLEDPNNPEGKVLLPKEVFDQFYNRTLTLRKT